MFHFPAFPPHTLCVQVWVTAHDDCRVSPFGHPRIKARLTAPRGLSRPPTSFIGSWCQGIHRAPLKTWPQMLASTVQFSNNDQTPMINTLTGISHETGSPRSSAIRPFPQDPTTCPTHQAVIHVPRRSSTSDPYRVCRIVNVPPMSYHRRTFADVVASDQASLARSAP